MAQPQSPRQPADLSTGLAFRFWAGWIFLPKAVVCVTNVSWLKGFANTARHCDGHDPAFALQQGLKFNGFLRI